MDRRQDENVFELPGAVPWFPPANYGAGSGRVLDRSSISELPSNERADVISTTHQELLRFMKVPNDKYKMHERFIIQEDLDIIYANPARIPALITPDCNDVDMNVVRRDMRKILTILILIGARECLGLFKKCLYSRQTPDLVDGDLPITQRTDLWFLSPQLQDRFIYEQHVVRPLKIREDYAPSTIYFEPPERLPFQYIEEGIVVGGFGTIDRITIPPGYVEDRRGRYYDIVACKRFRVDPSSTRKAGNLGLLKARLTLQQNILLHLAAVARADMQYILFPFAAHFDLDIFLRCGLDEHNLTVYNFSDTFPLEHGFAKSEHDAHQVTVSLLRQSAGIAHALQWLHHDAFGTTGLYCAHVDLKPANILIVDPVDLDNCVGIWKITDFCVAVYHEGSTQQDSNFVSPLGYIQQLNGATQFSCVTSAYTAPELRRNEPTISRSANIWAFGCLFSEVLMFAFGRHSLVQEFRNVRMQWTQVDTSQPIKDRFYMQQNLSALVGPSPQELFVLKPWMVDWLLGLLSGQNAGTQQDWLRCCLMTILEILVIDLERRPTARVVMKLIEHLSAHFDCAKIGKAVACPYRSTLSIERNPSAHSTEGQLSPSAESSRRGSRTYQQQPPSAGSATPPSTYWRPSIERSDTMGREVLLQASPNSQKIPMSPTSTAFTQSTPISPASDLTIRTRTNSSKSSVPPILTSMPPRRGIKIPTASQPLNASMQHLRLQVTRQGRKQIETVDISKLDKPIDISVSPNGELIAYLIKSTVYLFTLHRSSAQASWMNPGIELPTNVIWKQVAIAGDYMVTWGTCDGKKQILFWSLSTRTCVAGPSHSEVAKLKAIQVAASGAVAIMCAQCIVFTSIGLYASHGYQQTLDIDRTRTFSSIAFNNTGTYLHAWNYGPKFDELKVWRVGGVTIDAERPKVQQFTRSNDAAGTRLYPFTHSQKAIIEAPRANLFSNFATADRNKASMKVANIFAGTVFRDHSLITLEAGSRLSCGKLKEYAIHHSGAQSLVDRPETLEQLKHIKLDHGSPVAMSVTEVRASICITVCGEKGDVELLDYG